MQLDEGGRQSAPVGIRGEHHLGRVVQALVEAPIAHRGAVRRVGGGDELLEVGERIDTRVGVAQLRVHARLFHLLAHHDEVRHERLVIVASFGDVDNRGVVGAVLRLDIRRHSGADVNRAKLRLGELGPHLWEVNLLRVLKTALERLDGLEEHLHGVDVEVKLLEDGERLLVEFTADGDALRHLGR